MKILTDKSMLGLKLENMGIESRRLYATIKIITEVKPTSKIELLAHYDTAIDAMSKEYLKEGKIEFFNQANDLIEMKNFIASQVEEINIDGLK